MRLASLAPSNTDILTALGLAGSIVAVDDWSDLPPDSRAVRLGGEMDIDIHRLQQERPDLVISSLSVPGMEDVVRKVDEAGMPQIVLDPERLEDIYRDIVEVGMETGREDEAFALVERMHERVNAMRRVTMECGDVPRVYLEWWPDPHITPGRRNWATDMIEVAGGWNIFSKVDARSMAVDAVEVMSASPEVIILCWCGMMNAKMDPAVVKGRAGWDDIPAVTSNRIHLLEERSCGRPGPGLLSGCERMLGFIHPELERETGG